MPRNSLEPYLWNLENLFKNVYDVPVYQRPYSWGKEQVEVLLRDIYDAYDSPQRNDGYYTGNIILYDKNERLDGLVARYEIIDGQQRIATFALLLLSVYCCARKCGVEDAEKTLSAVKQSLWKYINRTYRKDCKTVQLNSIEKACFSALYDACFDTPEEILHFCEQFSVRSVFEGRVLDNFTLLYASIHDRFASVSADALLDFADYLLQHIQFIVIEASCNESKVFSTFESINSKGKRLEDIDLIKTYIFSRLDEASYQTYLNKWGQLIIKTNDNLYDYLYTYIRAYLVFYRQNISVKNFKSLCQQELFSHFGIVKDAAGSEAAALKKLLDDLYDKVDYYNMLFSAEKAYQLIGSKKFRFYFRVFTELSYKHPKPLFFRMLVDFSQHKLTRDDALSIVVDTIGFMVKFLTISDRDSKDAITLFSNIMNDVYLTGKISSACVKNSIAAELIAKNIRPEALIQNLASMDAYEGSKKLTVALLSLYEAYGKNDRGEAQISYDQAYTILDAFSASFSLDHLLVQTPDENSGVFCYYPSGDNMLCLKDGHDFPDEIKPGMEYSLFVKTVLNRIGNLRIYYRDKNSGRGNAPLQLKEITGFTKYKDIDERSFAIAEFIINTGLPAPQVDLAELKTATARQTESALPKMRQLIEYDLVKPGDDLYIILQPQGSAAKLIDDKYVLFGGEKMTLNEWGCKVTGWKSIRIYSYAAILGETETLQDKRQRFIRDHNEAPD